MPILAIRAPYVPAFAKRPAPIVRVGAATASELKPLRPTPNVITPSDLKSYVDLLAPLIDSLNKDIQTNVATGDAAQLEVQAQTLEFEASKIEDGLPAYAAELRARAAAKRALASKGGKLSSKQLADQVAFATDWDAFYSRWGKEAEYVRGIKLLTSGGDWTTLQGFDLEYQNFDKRYRAFGFSPTMGVPPSAPEIGSIPWGWIAFGIVIIGVALVLGQIRGFVPTPAR